MRGGGEAGRRTATSRTRREQIAAALVDIVADEGYAAATFQHVARRAGLSSTRLISYHFADKDELVAVAFRQVLAEIGAAVDATPEPDPRAALAGYIRTAVGLNVTHRTQMRALMRIILDHRPAGGRRLWEPEEEQAALTRVQAILADGQAGGVFRAFDTEVVAAAVQRAVDGVPFLLERRPDTDLTHYADELVTLFDRATRA